MKKFAIILIIASLVFNVTETAYFGFNMKAMSRAEEVCDVICSLLFNVGFGILIVWAISKHSITVSVKEKEEL